MSYGPERLLGDLAGLGFKVESRTVNDGAIFVVVPSFHIVSGRFEGRQIDLGVQSTADFPRTVHSAIHVKADPQLFDYNDSVQNVRNIQKSALGDEWRYWSHNFNWTSERSARRLLSQINAIFDRA